jgi:hypothetical protein
LSGYRNRFVVADFSTAAYKNHAFDVGLVPGVGAWRWIEDPWPDCPRCRGDAAELTTLRVAVSSNPIRESTMTRAARSASGADGKLTKFAADWAAGRVPPQRR